jgi:O-antigen/teichoic acid export membrane protein
MNSGLAENVSLPDVDAAPAMARLTFDRLWSDMFAYAVMLAVPKLLVVFTVPLYTRQFTTAQYGTLQMGMAAAMVLAPIVGIGMEGAQSYFFFAREPDGTLSRPQVVSAVLYLRMLWGLTVWCGVLGLLAIVPHGPLRSEGFPWYLAAAAAGVCLEQISGQAADVFRLLHRRRSYALTTGLQAAGGATLGLAFAIGLGWGVTGVFLASASAAAMTAVAAWMRHGALVDLSTRRIEWWPRLLRFGLPLVPAAFGQMVLYSLDRWLLVAFKAADAVGVYGAGAELAGVVALVVATFRVAWWPIAMAEINEDRTDIFSTAATAYVGIAAIIGVVSAYVFPIATAWLLPGQYAGASTVAAIIPWRWLAYGFIPIASIGTWRSERTWWSAAPIAIALAVHAAGGALLIPMWGIDAAAWTAVAGAIAWVASALAISERLYHIGYRYALLAAQTGIGLTATAVLVHFSSSASSSHAAARLLVTMTACLVLAATLTRRGDSTHNSFVA